MSIPYAKANDRPCKHGGHGIFGAAVCPDDGCLRPTGPVSMISIDCTAVADKVAHAIRQRSELYWLVYNDPIGYADLILNGDPEQYLKDITKQD